MGKKVNVSQESFVTSTEDVAAELAADAAGEEIQTPLTDDRPTVCINSNCTAYDAEAANGCGKDGEVYECSECVSAPIDEAEQVPVEIIPEITAELAHEGDPCMHCGVAHDDVGKGACPAKITTPFTSDGNQAYVTRDPDFIGATFTRALPVPVPAEELAELAMKMSHTHGIWYKAKLDAKAAAKGFKGITDKAEDEMVELAAIIEEGTEERPVVCRWEFDYTAGIKKLRRLDNYQISDEETLKGEELHMSFNFNGSSEAAVQQLAERQAELNGEESQEPASEDFSEEVIETGVSPLCPGCQIEAPNCADCPDHREPVAHEDATHVDSVETSPEHTPSCYPCKICGFDAGSHIYLVRHLRDVHALKLSEYKLQYPVEK